MNKLYIIQTRPVRENKAPPKRGWRIDGPPFTSLRQARDQVSHYSANKWWDFRIVAYKRVGS
jgi:hypothetical protein